MIYELKPLSSATTSQKTQEQKETSQNTAEKQKQHTPQKLAQVTDKQKK